MMRTTSRRAQSQRRGMSSASTSGPDPSPTATGRTALSLHIEDGLYKVGALERYPELLHGIATRYAPDGADWNLSSKRGTPQHPPSWDAAIANREKLARRLGISLDRMVGCHQVHGSEVALVRAEDAG